MVGVDRKDLLLFLLFGGHGQGAVEFVQIARGPRGHLGHLGTTDGRGERGSSRRRCNCRWVILGNLRRRRVQNGRQDIGRLGTVLFGQLGDARRERGAVRGNESTKEKAHVERVPAEGVVVGGHRFLGGLFHDQGRRLRRGRDRVRLQGIDQAKFLPGTGVHGQIFQLGEVVGESGSGLGLTLQLLHGLLEDVVLLAQFRALEGVDADDLVLLHVHAFDELVDLLLSTHPFAFFAKQFGLPDLHAPQGILEVVDDMGELLLFLLQFFGVEFLALARIQTNQLAIFLETTNKRKPTQPGDSGASAFVASTP